MHTGKAGHKPFKYKTQYTQYTNTQTHHITNESITFMWYTAISKLLWNFKGNYCQMPLHYKKLWNVQLLLSVTKQTKWKYNSKEIQHNKKN